MVNDLKRLEDMLVEVVTNCHDSVKKEVELEIEYMDFGGNVDDAYETGVNNGRAELAKEILKVFKL